MALDDLCEIAHVLPGRLLAMVTRDPKIYGSSLDWQSLKHPTLKTSFDSLDIEKSVVLEVAIRDSR